MASQDGCLLLDFSFLNVLLSFFRILTLLCLIEPFSILIQHFGSLALEASECKQKNDILAAQEAGIAGGHNRDFRQRNEYDAMCFARANHSMQQSKFPSNIIIYLLKCCLCLTLAGITHLQE